MNSNKFLILIAFISSVCLAQVKFSELTLNSAADVGSSDSFPYVVSGTPDTNARLLVEDIVNLPSLVAAYAPLSSPTFTGSVTASSGFVGPLTGTVTGTASNITGTSNSTLTTLSALSLPMSQVSGQATLAQLPSIANSTILGNNNGSTHVPIALTVAQVNAILPAFTTSLAGLAPASGGGTTNYLRADGSWASPGSGSGSVTSVALSDASSVPIYAVSGSPVTSTGTLTLTLSNENANLVFAGPTSGVAGQPGFRSLVTADVPTLNQNTTGTAANVTGTSNSTLATLSGLTTASSLATIGTVTSGTWHGTAVGSQYGGTGLNTSASTGVPSIASGTWSVNTLLPISLGGLNASSAAVGTIPNATSSTVSAWTASPTLGVNATTQGVLNLATSVGGGASVSVQNGGATSAYNFNLPTTSGTAGQFLTSGGGTTNPMTWSNTGTVLPPTVQKFLVSGAATYTLPTSPAPTYIEVRMVGGGGGGGGGAGGANMGGGGGTGGNTTFGTTLLAANGGTGGGGGNVGPGAGGAGGTASLGSGPIGMATPGGTGTGAASLGSLAAFSTGGPGAASCLGGGGGGGVSAAGTAGTTNSGAGGGGGGGNNTATTPQGGFGGGAGGCVDAFITSPSSTYSINVGAFGTAGTAGTNGNAGGAGALGEVVVIEYYSTVPAALTNPMTTASDTIYGGTSGAPSRLAAGTAGQVYQTNGTANPPGWVTSHIAQNVGITASVGSSALTVSLVQASGSTATAGSPVSIPFRNGTAATGQVAPVQVTGSLSITVPSTATLGQTSAVNQYVWVYALNDAGTVDICVSGINVFFNTTLNSATQVSSGATSGAVLYCGSAHSGAKPTYIVGRLLVNETTAGTWATAPSELDILPVPTINKTDWATFTPSVTHNTGGITNDTPTGQWRRDGDTEEIQVQIAFTGTPAAFNGVFMSLPTGGTPINTTKLLNTTAGSQWFGGTSILSPGVNLWSGEANYNNTTTVELRVFTGTNPPVAQAISNTSPTTFGTGMFIGGTYKVPIAGWSTYGP